MTPSERDTARAQQIADDYADHGTRHECAVAIRQALAEVRAEYKTPERPESLGSYMLGRD